MINELLTVMKNLHLFLLLLACIGFQNCKKNQSQKDIKVIDTDIEVPINTICYKALYENDTIELKINTLKNRKITGNMAMKIFNRPNKVGKLAGEFRGDTLFAAYTFIQGANTKVTYKNPIALLKQDSTLILGNGKIETIMGATYFVKGIPIDFDRVKYKFKMVVCEMD